MFSARGPLAAVVLVACAATCVVGIHNAGQRAHHLRDVPKAGEGGSLGPRDNELVSVYRLMAETPSEAEDTELRIKMAGRADMQEAHSKRKELIQRGTEMQKKSDLKRNLRQVGAEETERARRHQEMRGKDQYREYGMSMATMKRLAAEEDADQLRMLHGDDEDTMSNWLNDEGVRQRAHTAGLMRDEIREREEKKIARERKDDPWGAGHREGKAKRAKKFVLHMVKENDHKRAAGLPYENTISLGRLKTETLVDAEGGKPRLKVPVSEPPSKGTTREALASASRAAFVEAAALNARARAVLGRGAAEQQKWNKSEEKMYTDGDYSVEGIKNMKIRDDIRMLEARAAYPQAVETDGAEWQRAHPDFEPWSGPGPIVEQSNSRQGAVAETDAGKPGLHFFVPTLNSHIFPDEPNLNPVHEPEAAARDDFIPKHHAPL